MNWFLSNRFDPRAVRIADRHYNRQKVGTNQFVPPGSCLVLLTANADAVWVSSRPQFVMHKWKYAWICTVFRNEGKLLSSKLIQEAVSATVHEWGVPPEQGMITFINPAKVKPKRDPGYCFIKAGFHMVGFTQKRHYITLQLERKDFPPAFAANDWQMDLWN